MVLGKSKLGEKTWQLKTTSYKANVSNAHNVISIMVDGEGYLHMAWDHHNNKLQYARSDHPGSLDLISQIKMIGEEKTK